MESIDLVKESTNRLTDLKPDCLLKVSLSSNCSPLTVSFTDEHSGQASCCEPDLFSEPETSTVPPLSSSQASDQTTGCLLRGPGTSGREASYTQVSEVRSNGKLVLSPELEQSSSKDAKSDSELGAVTHPSSSHDPESTAAAASPAPAYTLVGATGLVVTPDATPSLKLVIPKNVPTPTGYLMPDLLGSITP